MSVITFVIPTVGASKNVSRCVDSIAGQLSGEDEIIIVHQGEDNPVRFAPVARLFHVSEYGLSNARNEGARLAGNGIIAFIDDDVMLDKNYAASIRKHFSRDISALCGRLLNTDDHSPYARVHDDKLIAITYSPARLKRCLGGNMVFRKEAFLDVGGYDRSFGVGAKYGGAEDIDIILRLLHRKKHRVIYAPDAIGYHARENRHKNSNYIEKVFNYGMGEGAVYAKHFMEKKLLVLLAIYGVEIAKPFIKLLSSTLAFDVYGVKVYSGILKGRLKGFFDYANEKKI
ncbi:MAG: hypothetical protein A2219_03410 [Elusimicrobia bacterium RIFOXYA2_FULL_50_26]|nr:MAG: hypothetical protein A2219_03410 [Elusimicrobia bacterium RIFOXYA2_FULL_50_26]OGS25344.1 MAG: hypothetical protein A2314_06400 [Elusimicrobia bacterium RIFOXYB2_FULL_50_12]